MDTLTNDYRWIQSVQSCLAMHNIRAHISSRYMLAWARFDHWNSMSTRALFGVINDERLCWSVQLWLWFEASLLLRVFKQPSLLVVRNHFKGCCGGSFGTIVFTFLFKHRAPRKHISKQINNFHTICSFVLKKVSLLVLRCWKRLQFLLFTSLDWIKWILIRAQALFGSIEATWKWVPQVRGPCWHFHWCWLWCRVKVNLEGSMVFNQ